MRRKVEDIYVLTIMQKVLLMVLEISAPILVVAIVVGLAVSIFQSITQIQEATLTFVPKMIAAILTIIFLMPWMLNVFITRTNELFSYMTTLIRT